MTIRLAILITIIVGIPARAVLDAWIVEPVTSFYPIRHLSALDANVIWLTIAIIASVALWSVWPYVREWYDANLKDLDTEP